jgi:hypothetical protein
MAVLGSGLDDEARLSRVYDEWWLNGRGPN